MCSGGGGGGSSASNNQTAQLQQQQMAQQAQQSAAQLAEQQREFGIQQQQTAATLANQQSLQAQQAQQVAQQAQLTQDWETGRASNEARATDTVNQAFAQFTPDYYKQYTQAYENHYQPQVTQQFDQASNQTDYGLARSGNLQSQTAADQFGTLAQEKGIAQADITNSAVGATNALQTNVLNAKQNLMGQATSDATLGSPVTPGSADAITANFNQTAHALSQIQSTAGDTVNAIAATPQYSSLGSLFSSAASGLTAAQSGVNSYNYGQAYNAGLAGSTGAASPTQSSGRVGG